MSFGDLKEEAKKIKGWCITDQDGLEMLKIKELKVGHFKFGYYNDGMEVNCNGVYFLKITVCSCVNQRLLDIDSI